MKIRFAIGRNRGAYLAFVLCSGWLSGVALGTNNYLFPHFAHGPVSSSSYYQTTFYFSSPTVDLQGIEPNSITLNCYNSTGGLVNVELVSPDKPLIHSTTGTLNFSLSPGETLIVRTTGTPAGLQVGWCQVESAYPLLCTEDFTYFVGSGVGYTVGVLPAEAGCGFSMPVVIGSAEPGPGLATDMGVAIGVFNHTDAAGVSLRLYDSNNYLVSTKFMTLPKRGYTAQFLSGIFSDYSFGASFHGRLQIVASTNVTVMALKGVSGVYSSLAVLPKEKLATHQIQETESNNDPAHSDPIGQRLPAVVSGSFANWYNTQDVDNFYIDLVNGQTIHIVPLSFGLGMLRGDADYSVEVQDSAHNTLVKHNSYYHLADADPIVFTAPTLNTYFIVVSGWSDASDDIGYRLLVY